MVDVVVVFWWCRRLEVAAAATTTTSAATVATTIEEREWWWWWWKWTEKVVTVGVVGGGIKTINEKSHRPQNSTMSHLLNSAPQALRNF